MSDKKRELTEEELKKAAGGAGDMAGGDARDGQASDETGYMPDDDPNTDDDPNQKSGPSPSQRTDGDGGFSIG